MIAVRLGRSITVSRLRVTPGSNLILSFGGNVRRIGFSPRP
jgi:hypothetical protein